MAEGALKTAGQPGKTWMPLWLQVLIGAVLGVLVGIVWPHFGAQTLSLIHISEPTRPY